MVTSSDGSSVAGVLIVASSGTEGFSTVSDSGGNYTIYNVTSGSFTVTGWASGISSDSQNAIVSAGMGTPSVNLTITGGVAGGVNGSITFLATGNIDIDVALTHPETGETIFGLSTMTSNGAYNLTNVGDGTYLARATFSNDGLVMDPDWIIKNGEPFVSVTGGSAIRDFSVTGAVGVISPSNVSTSTDPIEINTLTPTFEWNSYSSTSDYVIEIMDSNGKLIWGGFSTDWSTKNIFIPSSQTNVVFNSDGNAVEPLEEGKVYRWRVYASKDDTKELTGWKLISVSEDQMGLFKIVL